MSDSDAYEYSDLEYSSDEGSEQDEGDQELVEIENTFYDADDIFASKPERAIELFAKVVELESARGGPVKFRFKSILKLVQLQFQQSNFTAMVKRYEELLTYIDAVTSNELQDGIQTVLGTVSASTEVGMLARVYEVTLQALKAAHNERLWFSTLCKKARLFIMSKDWAGLEPLVEELHDACRSPDGADDVSKGNHLMEVYALEIQLAAAKNDRKRQKLIYDRVNALNAAVSDPRVIGVVRQAFGVMRMTERRWEAAYDELYAAFKSYQEAGHHEARTCLKYLVLANILSSSSIDPFDSPEALVYKEDREVKAMSELRTAYQRNDIKLFQRVLNDKRNKIASDYVIAPLVSDLLRNVRRRVVLRIVRPYSAVRLSFLAEELTISSEEVETLLVGLILDGSLEGKMDQIEGILRLKSSTSSGNGMNTRSLAAIEEWTKQLANLRQRIGKSLVA